MNILFSSDDNYARHMGVAIHSLLSHNRKVSKIRLFIVNNNISSDNISKINQVIFAHDNAELTFIPFEKWAESLHLNMSWPISLSSYARLFVGEMLPDDVERILYLDSDMLVCDDISNLWDTELGDKMIGAVQDQVNGNAKTAVGLNLSDNYFNAGLLLVDLKKWRNEEMGEKCLNFIASYGGQVTHHDQGTLNGLLKNLWLRLPLKYNVMTIHYIMTQSKIKRFFRDKSSFYDLEEIEEAMLRPSILHFTPSFTSHPWEQNCKHPKRDLYRCIQNETPWANYPLEKTKSPWYVKLINYYYRNCPIF